MLDEHLGYVSDSIRYQHFKTAIARTIKHGDRVADLGCGSGVLGLLSLEAGAAHVVDIGVRIVEGGIESHAWVEHEGRPVNDTPGVLERFTATRPDPGAPQ